MRLRTAQRWLPGTRPVGRAGSPGPRAGQGTRRLPDELRLLIEGLALHPPEPSAAHARGHPGNTAPEYGWKPHGDLRWGVTRR
ncbi:hypothetical protein FRAHR75_220038 [Frankia sp. Hr75.2]|nr:hypothetical protein FRAHR75_220038 [Frankia sp. Hr75.2]